MPGNASSSPRVAVLRLIGPLPWLLPASGSGTRGGGLGSVAGGRRIAETRHEDPLAVGDLGGEVQPVEVSLGNRTARGLDCIDDTRAGVELDHARPRDGARDVHNDEIVGLRGRRLDVGAGREPGARGCRRDAARRHVIRSADTDPVPDDARDDRNAHEHREADARVAAPRTDELTHTIQRTVGLRPPRPPEHAAARRPRRLDPGARARTVRHQCAGVRRREIPRHRRSTRGPRVTWARSTRGRSSRAAPAPRPPWRRSSRGEARRSARRPGPALPRRRRAPRPAPGPSPGPSR